MGEMAFRRLLSREPWRKEVIRLKRMSGELGSMLRVESCQPGWQGSAWLLERTRGYVARAAVEHSGKVGGKLTIAHQVTQALSGGEREAPAIDVGNT